MIIARAPTGEDEEIEILLVELTGHAGERSDRAAIVTAFESKRREQGARSGPLRRIKGMLRPPRTTGNPTPSRRSRLHPSPEHPRQEHLGLFDSAVPDGALTEMERQIPPPGIAQKIREKMLMPADLRAGRRSTSRFSPVRGYRSRMPP